MLRGVDFFEEGHDIFIEFAGVGAAQGLIQIKQQMFDAHFTQLSKVNIIYTARGEIG